MYKATILTSQTLSAATNTVSTRLRYIKGASVQVSVSAVSSPVGQSVKLQASNDNTNWVDISGTANNITAISEIMMNVSDIGFKWLRAAFLRTSGTVTVSAIIVGKEHNLN